MLAAAISLFTKILEGVPLFTTDRSESVLLEEGQEQKSFPGGPFLFLFHPKWPLEALSQNPRDP